MENKLYQKISNLNLLYVEDNKEARDALLYLFNDMFKNVIYADNGQEGYAKFLDNINNIDLVITDINMPKMDGLEMSQKIRQKNPYMPIIIFSAYSEKEYFLNSVTEYFKICNATLSANALPSREGK